MRVALLIRGWSFKAKETAAGVIFATFAMSFMVALFLIIYYLIV